MNTKSYVEIGTQTQNLDKSTQDKSTQDKSTQDKSTQDKSTQDKSTQVNMDEEEKLIRGKTIKKENIRKIIFGGGFFKGYCFCGCIKYLFEHNLIQNIDVLIGSSVGSICALLLSLNYKNDEIENLITSFDFNKYENITLENIIDFTENFGFDNGEKFSQVIKNVIYTKTKNCYITFKQLYNIYKKTLIITGTNLESRKTEYFSHLTTPDMPVWLAIRISTSYPIFYNIVEYNNIKYIDGAASSNCSIEVIDELFDGNYDDTLCISLNNFEIFENTQPQIEHIKEINKTYNLYDYIMDLTGSLRYRDIIRLKKYSYNLLIIKSDFQNYKEKIEKQEIYNLIQKGYNQITMFFSN